MLTTHSISDTEYDKHTFLYLNRGSLYLSIALHVAVFTLDDRRRKYTDAQRFQALLLFRKGLSLRSMAEIIGTNNVTILQWMRSMGRHVKEAVLSQTIEMSESLDVIEIDEMWHYVEKNSKNYEFGLLTLVPKDGLLPAKSVLVATKH